MKRILLLGPMLWINIISAKEVRWGLLSTARFNEPIIEALRQCKRSKISAVASRSLKKAKDYAHKHKIEKYYGSYQEMFDDPEIDVVFISLPNSMHGYWTLKAIEAGKHVLCEKPFVNSIEEFENIERALEKNKVTIMEGLAYIYHPQTQKLLEILQSKKIGDVHMMDAKLHIQLDTGHLAQKPEHGEIRLDPQLGGGSLWDLGIYCSSILLLLNENKLPKEVCAFKINGESGVDIATTGIIKFNENLLAHFSTDFYTEFSANLTIYGTKGKIELNGPWHPSFFKENSIIIKYDDGHKESIATPIGNPFIYEIQAMEDAILHSKKPFGTMQMSKKFLKTILAIEESIKTSKVVAMQI